jgi:Restriction endonuclease EcoRV
MAANATVLKWLREVVADYALDLVAVLRKEGTTPSWPLTAKDPDDLVTKLAAGGHLVPLPKEPAALANVLEVSLVDFILAKAAQTHGLQATRGTERGYPDIELSGPAVGGRYHAVDIKNARRNRSGRATQSAITLYTGNTYFRYPTLRWPGTFRPFAEYESHIDILGIYTLDESLPGRITDLELIVQEPWRIASKQRSSSTREYIGAVKNIEALRNGDGAFPDEAAFYDYWRKFRFKIGPTVQAQLDKLLFAAPPNPADEKKS